MKDDLLDMLNREPRVLGGDLKLMRIKGIEIEMRSQTLKAFLIPEMLELLLYFPLCRVE